MFHQGVFKPTHPEKYKGKYTDIVYRSSWEKRYMIWCDTNPSILEWSSEEIIIPYQCGTDNKVHRYYPDFVMKVQTKTNQVKIYMVEIKPRSQRLPPTKRNKNYLTESLIFIKNQSKWKYAKKYCEVRGWEFIVLDEYDLGIS